MKTIQLIFLTATLLLGNSSMAEVQLNGRSKLELQKVSGTATVQCELVEFGSKAFNEYGKSINCQSDSIVNDAYQKLSNGKDIVIERVILKINDRYRDFDPFSAGLSGALDESLEFREWREGDLDENDVRTPSASKTVEVIFVYYEI